MFSNRRIMLLEKKKSKWEILGIFDNKKEAMDKIFESKDGLEFLMTELGASELVVLEESKIVNIRGK
jgi:hypothetical protein